MSKVIKYVVYSHEKCNPESDMYMICICKSKSAAEYVVSALEYRDSGGKKDNGMYDYYIREE